MTWLAVPTGAWHTGAYQPLQLRQWNDFDRKNPPPPGRVSYLLCSLIKNPEEKDPPRAKQIVGGVSSFSGFLIREHSKLENPPRGGGFFRSACNHVRQWHDLQCPEYAWCSCMNESGLVHMCDMTCFYVFNVTHSYVWRDSFLCVRWLIHMFATICVMLLYERGMSHIWMSHATCTNESCHTNAQKMRDAPVWMSHVTRGSE